MCCICSLFLQVLSQVHKRFESFVQDENTNKDFLLYSTILRTLARISTNADPVFRDQCELKSN